MTPASAISSALDLVDEQSIARDQRTHGKAGEKDERSNAVRQPASRSQLMLRNGACQAGRR